jgi:hypothetical protein
LEPAESSRQGDRLVFDKDAFATPRNRQIVDPNVQSRLKLIEETIDKYSTPTLLVPVEDLEDFFAAFRSGGANSARTPSQVAIEELSQFLSPESARIWKNFYQTNLGINFTEGKKWFESLLHNAKSCPSELVDEVAERLVRFLLSYVFYVDMIITTIQKPTHVVVNRSLSFHLAMASFKHLTPQYLKDDDFLNARPKKHLAFLFIFLSRWVASDEYYRSSDLCDRYELSRSAKSYFNFIFANTRDNLTKRLPR